LHLATREENDGLVEEISEKQYWEILNQRRNQIMSKSLEDGYDEITVTVAKTLQEFEYEPLKMVATLKRMVKPEEVSSGIREISEILETEICDFLDIR